MIVVPIFISLPLPFAFVAVVDNAHRRCRNVDPTIRIDLDEDGTFALVAYELVESAFETHLCFSPDTLADIQLVFGDWFVFICHLGNWFDEIFPTTDHSPFDAGFRIGVEYDKFPRPVV